MALPIPTPVTLPCESTLATLLFVLYHSKVASDTLVTVAINLIELPTLISSLVVSKTSSIALLSLLLLLLLLFPLLQPLNIEINSKKTIIPPTINTNFLFD